MAAAVGAEVSPRERIMAAAEQLFARHGMASVSIRAITGAARVNLASLNYHFGSKEQLLAEIFERRARPIAEARVQALSGCVEAPGRPPLLEQLLEAFLRPSFALGKEGGDGEGAIFVKLRARVATEPEGVARRILSRAFNDSSRLYIDALAQALPHLPREEVLWRFHFLLGAMVYTMADVGRIQSLSAGAGGGDGRCDPGESEEALRHMIPFLAAGFRSPPIGGAAAPRPPAAGPTGADPAAQPE